MAKYKGKYRSESHRLQGWDYSREAIYFITFCVQDFECLFGDVVGNETHDGASVRMNSENNKSARMNLNQFGQIVEDEIQKSIV